ncbi:hypothetical protein QTL54_22530, partial [Klebsiella michiganensis]
TIFGVHYPLRNIRICQTVLRRRLLLFNVFYITYCINDMQQALAKHQIIHRNTTTPGEHAPAQAAEQTNQP